MRLCGARSWVSVLVVASVAALAVAAGDGGTAAGAQQAAGQKTYRWFAHAFYSNSKTSTVSSYAEGPRGSGRGLLTVAGGRTSGGRSAHFRITDTLKGGNKHVISILTDGVARFSFGAGGGATLVLRAHVTGSTHPGCKKGKRVLLTLVDGASATPDSLEVKGCGAVRRYVERKAHMVVHVVIDQKSGARPTTTRDPIVGLWKSEDIVYRWVAIKGGYEERTTTPLWDEDGCKALAGEAMTHYVWNRVKGSQVYEEIHRSWKVKPDGPGDDGMGCSRAWERDKGMVKIVRTGKRMTVSCDNDLNNPCHTYARVGP